MTLSTEDSDLFYDLWFPLLNYVNKELKVIPQMGKIYRGKYLNPVLMIKIAAALWDNVRLIDEYLAKHGDKISEENRGIIMGWKRRIAGKFILERHLSTGSVFLSLQTKDVYLVKGIISSWKEMLPNFRPPIALDAVLIPFKNVIITDGLVSPYDVMFGKNYEITWKEMYMDAKKSGNIIKTI